MAKRLRKKPLGVFYAYPALPQALAETIRVAMESLRDIPLIKKRVLRIRLWPDMHPSGRRMIKQITENIDKAEVFACDLTHANLNVAFELGYAIGRFRRGWISLDTTLTTATKEYQRLYGGMFTAGYAGYSNHKKLAEQFMSDQPWSSLENQMLHESYKKSAPRAEHPTLLYLRPQIETDAVIANGTFSARRTTITGWSNWGEASTAEYGNLVGTDDAYYQSADPGGGDNAAMIFELYVTETPADITRIDVNAEVAQGVNTDAMFLYLWNYNTSSYAVCCTDIDFTIQNDGATAVVDFSQMDVVVQYTLASITYADYGLFTTLSSPQPSDTWRALSISNDVIDPRVLNTGESLNGTLRVFPAVGTGTSNWLQVTTELGISASSFFTN